MGLNRSGLATGLRCGAFGRQAAAQVDRAEGHEGAASKILEPVLTTAQQDIPHDQTAILDMVIACPRPDRDP